VKFVHAADLHIDSPLRGLDKYEGAPAARLRAATRRALENLVALCIEERAAFLLLAGDVFDGTWKDFSTGLFFATQMTRLREAQIPVVIVRGNHDAASSITKNLRLPDNVRELSSKKPDTIELGDAGTCVHGQSFAQRAVTDDLAARYPDAVRGAFNVGLLHTCLDGREGHERYAPTTLEIMRAKGYDYWALGHVHAREVLSKDPWIVFPGNLQGRHARETGAKGCMLVTVEDRQVVAAEHRAVDVLRWAALSVDADSADAATLTGRIADQVRSALCAAHGRPVLARLTLTGSTELHGRLLGDTERLAAECRNAALDADGDLWVERVDVRTRLPIGTSVDAGAFAALQDGFAAALDDPDLIARLLKDLAELRQKLPADALKGLDVPFDEAGLRAMAGDAWAVAADALDAAAA